MFQLELLLKLNMQAVNLVFGCEIYSQFAIRIKVPLR